MKCLYQVYRYFTAPQFKNLSYNCAKCILSCEDGLRRRTEQEAQMKYCEVSSPPVAPCGSGIPVCLCNDPRHVGGRY